MSRHALFGSFVDAKCSRPRRPTYCRPAWKVFSPAVGDPCFSRTTPDALFARIDEAEDRVGVAGSTKVWAGHILREKSRKLPFYGPQRKKYTRMLALQAAKSEKEAADRAKAKQVQADSPALFKPADSPESAFMEPRRRKRRLMDRVCMETVAPIPPDAFHG